MCRQNGRDYHFYFSRISGYKRTSAYKHHTSVSSLQRWRSVAPVGFLLCSCALLRLRVSGRPWQSTLVRLGSLLRLRSFSAIGLVLSFGSFELRAFFSQRLNCAQFPVDRCLAVFVKSGFVLFLEIFTPSCCTLYIGPQGSGDRSAYCPKSPPSCVLVGDVFERFDICRGPIQLTFLRVKNCGASIQRTVRVAVAA